jgi:hypothetical protein
MASGYRTLWGLGVIRRRKVFSTIGALGVIGLTVVLPVSSADAVQADARPLVTIGTLRTVFGDPGATSPDDFGYAVARSGSGLGSIVVVGASDANGTGAVYIYLKGSSGWPTTPTATLTDPAGISDDLFGYSVAASGNTIVVGADGTNSFAGAAYIYVKGPSGWPTVPTATLADPTATTGDFFGYSVAVSESTAVIGTFGGNSTYNRRGAGYVYVKGSSGWPTTPTATLAALDGTAHHGFGSSVAVSANTVVVGANGDYGSPGKAFIYVRGSSGWPTTPTVTLTAPAGTTSDNFGNSVAVSGNTVVVGAYGINSYAGAAYIYVSSSSGWPTKPTATLADRPVTPDEGFGYSVAVSGNTVVVGAPVTNSHTGAAFIYVRSTSVWPTNPTATLADPPATTNDNFGNSVAASEDTAVVGAYGTNSSEGAAYIYH